jgi:pimeloyl-ACP methyl ester carboxylesterase
MSITQMSRETIYNSPDKVASKFTQVDGYRTHYLEAGSEKSAPLVLVHGGAMGIGMGVDRWYPTVVPLSKNFRVFAVDELGSGETDAPRDVDSELTNTRSRADHVIGFIEGLDVGPVFLLGQSQGGWIVTYITLTRPDLVRRLVLVDSASASGGGFSKNYESNYMPYYDQVYEPGTRIPKESLDYKDRETLRERWKPFVYRAEAISEELLDRSLVLSERWNDLYMDRARKHWASDGWKKHFESQTIDGRHISELVGAIRIPTLMIWGSQSVKPMDKGIDLFKKIPGAQMHLFDRANHFLWLDQPDDFHGLVDWFLTKSVSD